MPLNTIELEILTDLTDQVRKLAVQTQKIYLEIEAMRMIVFPPLTIHEDAIRDLVSALDDSSANAMDPDRPSVAGIDSVRRRLITLGT
jgi:hypothetical protein